MICYAMVLLELGFVAGQLEDFNYWVYSDKLDGGVSVSVAASPFTGSRPLRRKDPVPEYTIIT